MKYRKMLILVLLGSLLGAVILSLKPKVNGAESFPKEKKNVVEKNQNSAGVSYKQALNVQSPVQKAVVKVDEDIVLAEQPVLVTGKQKVSQADQEFSGKQSQSDQLPAPAQNEFAHKHRDVSNENEKQLTQSISEQDEDSEQQQQDLINYHFDQQGLSSLVDSVEFELYHMGEKGEVRTRFFSAAGICYGYFADGVEVTDVVTHYIDGASADEYYSTIASAILNSEGDITNLRHSLVFNISDAQLLNQIHSEQQEKYSREVAENNLKQRSKVLFGMCKKR